MMRLGPWIAGIFSIAVIALWSIPAWSNCMEVSADFQLDGEAVPSNVSGAMFRNCESVVPDEVPSFGLYVDETDEVVEISVVEHEAVRSHREDEDPDANGNDSPDAGGLGDAGDESNDDDGVIEGVRRGLYEITFEEALADETTYRFEADPQCASHGLTDEQSWTFETTTEEELPETMGTWVPSSNVVGDVRWPHPETCTHVGEATYVNLTLEPSEQAEKWGEAIAFETWVNEEIWEPQLGVGETPPAGAGRLGWGDEQVYAPCVDEDGPEEKDYAPNLSDSWLRVNMDAWLPGTEQEWEGKDLTYLVACPDEEPDEEEDEEEEEEEDDEGDDTGGGTGDVEDEESACSQVGTSGSGLILVLAVVGFAAWRRRSQRLISR